MKINVESNIHAVLMRMDEYRRAVTEKAVPAALNRAAEATATAAARLVASNYRIKVSDAKKAMRTRRATENRLTALVLTGRKPIPLIYFGAKQVRTGVQVRVGKQTKLIKGAFIAKMKSGHVGVFMRADGAKHVKVLKDGRARWESLPIKELFGPSVGGALSGSREIQDALGRVATEVFKKRLAQELKFYGRKAGNSASGYTMDFN